MDTVDYLLNLPKQVAVGVNLSTISGQQLKGSGTLIITGPPEAEIQCLPGTFPHPEQIDIHSDCLVFIETGEIATLVCSITDINARGIIHVRARELIQHSDKRKYFRGPAGRLTIFCRHIIKKEKDNPEKEEMFKAGGVNISCGGILMIMDRPVAKKEMLALEIQTPEPCKKNISCRGVVVRLQKFQSSYFVAVKFNDLEPHMCDDIMAFCFAEQRRMLREMVIPKDI